VAKVRGAQAYQMLMVWRLYRGRRGTPGAGMFGKLAHLVDSWVAQDRGRER